jgi:hypothetical protein
MICRVTLCAAGFLILTATVFAQGPVVKVNVSRSGESSAEVADDLRAKIGSTLRYGLTEQSANADVVIEVICVGSGQSVACAAPTAYYTKGYGIARPLRTSVALGDHAWIATKLFESFVEQTSAEQLADADKTVTKITNNIWIEGYTAGSDAQKAACKPTVPKKN